MNKNFYYKGNKIELTENNRPKVITEDKNLYKELKKKGLSTELLLLLEEYYKENNITRFKKKKEQLNKEINIVVKLLAKEELFGGLFTYTFEIPGERIAINITTKDSYKKNTFYHLHGILCKDEFYNTKKKSRLEMAIGYERYKFELLSEAKEITLKKEVKEYSKPRYELHLHTLHSKRDAHISHEMLTEAFNNGKLAGLAITNHGINNCFPDSIKEFGKTDNKVIPACELYVIDDKEFELKELEWQQETQTSYDKLNDLTNELETKTELESNLKEEVESYKTKAASLREENKKLKEEDPKGNKEEMALNRNTIKTLGETKKTKELQRKETSAKIKELKKELKELEKTIKVLENTKETIGDATRYHLTVLLKTKNSIFKNDKYEFEYNEGIVELNRLITKASTDNFGVPAINKWLGKVCRPKMN